MHAHKLETLTLDFRDECLESCPELGQALACMNSIKHLSFLEKRCGERGIKVISQMQSPLSKLDIAFWDCEFHADVISALSSSASTLEVLQLYCITLQPSNVQFPRLHTLLLSDPLELDVEIMIKAFPNLVDLELQYPDADSLPDEELAAEIRMLNRQAQMTQCWTKLATVEGDLASIYALGLACHVRHLIVSMHYPREDVELPMVIADVRPLYVSLYIHEMAMERVAGFLERAPYVKTLALSVHLKYRFRAARTLVSSIAMDIIDCANP